MSLARLGIRRNWKRELWACFQNFLCCKDCCPQLPCSVQTRAGFGMVLACNRFVGIPCSVICLRCQGPRNLHALTCNHWTGTHHCRLPHLLTCKGTPQSGKKATPCAGVLSLLLAAYAAICQLDWLVSLELYQTSEKMRWVVGWNIQLTLIQSAISL